ncbi:MAG: MarR family transcriptional regulator [Anaerolineaceae bacterium]|jgi:DNA-binding MarR family transcriptional regulator|nr:MAG: MarR family transcriptional regulator [Anaerolineaceae bacterium]
MTESGEAFLALMNRLRKLGMGSPSSGTALVSPAQMALLDWIAASDGCGVQDIADGLNLTPPTVSVGVRRLEETGLLKRKSHPQDKRAVQFFLTAKGQSLQQQSQDFRRQKLELILSGLTQQEQDTLLELLAKALQTAESRDDEK